MAARFPAGAVHVSLDGAENAGVLVPEAAAALGVVAATAAELGTQLAVVTRAAPALLVLDGFDRYVEDAGQVGELLAGVPNLTVLATSRARCGSRPSRSIASSRSPVRMPRRCSSRARGRCAATGDRRGPAGHRCDLRALDGLPSRSSWPPTERLLPLPALLDGSSAASRS